MTGWKSALVLMIFRHCLNTFLPTGARSLVIPDLWKPGLQGSSVPVSIYCDPMRSGQKGGLEQAHTMLRMILPKKTNFEFLTQWDVNLIVSHINSTPGECLQGRTPYDVALETLGEETLKAFQLRRIAPDEVNLTPKLIRFNQ